MRAVKMLSVAAGAVVAALFFAGAPSLKADAAPPQNGWYEENGNKYWYEQGVRQGTEGRGKEIYDPDSDAWYWLDAIDNGRMAYSKDVYQESSGGKWVRYDKDGHMVKGWDTNKDGTYYFDLITGAMQKGEVTIDGLPCVFDKDTGIGLDCKWYQYEGKGPKYWYEGGKRQGYDPNNPNYRGKEIYDPASDAWYWLDNVDKGKMATGKDVYQESSGGKWVRYDDKGRMIKGEHVKDGATYRFDLITGAMIKGWFTITESDKKEYTYYYNPVNGKMYVNVAIELEGKNYLIDEKGHVVKGVVDDGKGAKYRYDAKTGEMIKGWFTEKDSAGKEYTYYYDEKTGKMTVGAKVIDEKSYMFDANGYMVKGWCTVGEKKYYYDPSTGVLARGIVRIDGVDQSFDEKTGEYKGKYEGGEVSYNWVVVGEVMQDSAGKDIGSVKYSYTDNGSLEKKTTYNANARKQRLTEESYTYDENGNVLTHYYQDFTDGTKTYKETFLYENGVLKKENTVDKNGSATWFKEHTYTNGRLTRTDVKTGDGNAYNYITYDYDLKGRVIKESSYNIYNVLTGYTQYRYHEYGSQSFLKSSFVYGADDAFLSGKEYTRSGYDLTKEIIYEAGRKIVEQTDYESAVFPTDGKETTFQKTSDTHDKNNKLIRHTIYDYELKDFIQ